MQTINRTMRDRSTLLILMSFVLFNLHEVLTGTLPWLAFLGLTLAVILFYCFPIALRTRVKTRDARITQFDMKLIGTSLEAGIYPVMLGRIVACVLFAFGAFDLLNGITSHDIVVILSSLCLIASGYGTWLQSRQ